jgi:glycosyltransferase involved in cell wall biosynthesis
MPQVLDRDCSLIIPAYNEEERIAELLPDLLTFGGEVIVVVDGDDRTAEIVTTFIRDYPDVEIVCLTSAERLGKGGGIYKGMMAATRRYIGFFDADRSTSVAEMKRIFSGLEQYDGVIGSRWVPGATIPIRQGLTRRVQSRVFNLLIRTLFGLHFADTQCGAKAFRREVLDAVLARLSATGFEFDVELLWRTEAAGFQIYELPIEWSDRGGSQVRLRDSLAMLAGLLHIRFS